MDLQRITVVPLLKGEDNYYVIFFQDKISQQSFFLCFLARPRSCKLLWDGSNDIGNSILDWSGMFFSVSEFL